MQMPIIPGVDGVLLELLLVTPRVGGDDLFAHGRPNHAAPKASTALRSERHRNPDSLAQEYAEDASNWYSPGTPSRGDRTGEGENEEEEGDLARDNCDSSSVSDSTGTGRVSTGGISSDNVDVRVGAVAMLLSEVAAQNWRTMESPLFDDRAGHVVGKIKMLARRGSMEEEETAAANKPTSAVRMEVEGATATNKSTEAATTTGAGAEAAVAGAAGAAAVTGTAAAPPPSMELVGGSLSGGQEDRSRARTKPASAATSVSATAGCSDGREDTNTPSTSHDALRTGGELLGRPAGGPAGTAEHPLAAVGLAVAAAAAAAANETPPRATILYRGLCLPFHWFRSTSPAAMDKTLRETLGEFVGEDRYLFRHKKRGSALGAMFLLVLFILSTASATIYGCLQDHPFLPENNRSSTYESYTVILQADVFLCFSYCGLHSSPAAYL